MLGDAPFSLGYPAFMSLLLLKLVPAWKLSLFLVARGVLGRDEAPDLYRDATVVTSEEEPLFSGEFGRARTRILLIEWASRESAGKKSALGAVGDCGRLQLVFLPALDGHSCEELRNDDTLDLRLGLRWMRFTVDYCGGSVVRGLAAYATGSCDSPRGLRIARKRLEEIGEAADVEKAQ